MRPKLCFEWECTFRHDFTERHDRWFEARTTNKFESTKLVGLHSLPRSPLVLSPSSTGGGGRPTAANDRVKRRSLYRFQWQLETRAPRTLCKLVHTSYVALPAHG